MDDLKTLPAFLLPLGAALAAAGCSLEYLPGGRAPARAAGGTASFDTYGGSAVIRGYGTAFRRRESAPPICAAVSAIPGVCLGGYDAADPLLRP